MIQRGTILSLLKSWSCCQIQPYDYKNSVPVPTVPHDTAGAIVFCIRQTILDPLTQYVEQYGVPVKAFSHNLAGTFL